MVRCRMVNGCLVAGGHTTVEYRHDGVGIQLSENSDGSQVVVRSARKDGQYEGQNTNYGCRNACVNNSTVT